MTTPRRTDSESARECEWQAQERAFAAERDASANDYPRDASVAVTPRDDRPTDAAGVADGRYRLIARALRAPTGDAPPADFAASVAARARRQERASQRFDAWLPLIVACLFGAGVIAATLFDARVWLLLTSAASSMLALLSGPWTLALIACVLVTAASTRVAGGVARR